MKKIVGIAIGGTKTSICIADKKNDLIINIKKYSIKTFADDYKSTLEEIFKILDSFENFENISVICGGPLDSKKGIIICPSNLPGFKNVKIVDIFKKRYKVNVALLNDADASALAEFKYGSGKGFNNFIYLTFGTGLGAGIIINGKLYSGSSDGAGEIGHVRLYETGHKARNGKKGSSESFASGGGISDLSESIFKKKISAKEVFNLAKKNDKKAKKIIEIASSSLGRVISILIDVFNPEAICIGGIYPRVENQIKDTMIDVIKKESLESNYKVCKILKSKLGEKIDDYSSFMAF